MNERLLELALRRQELRFRSSQLRRRWAEDAATLMPVIGAADGAMRAVRWVRRHSAVVVGAGVVLAVTKPRLVWRWLRRGYFTLQTFRRLRLWAAALKTE